MNPFIIFNTEEIERINNSVCKLENKDYTKDEWNKLENSLLEEIMSKSSKNGDISKASNEFKNIINKIENCIC